MTVSQVINIMLREQYFVGEVGEGASIAGLKGGACCEAVVGNTPGNLKTARGWHPWKKKEGQVPNEWRGQDRHRWDATLVFRGLGNHSNIKISCLCAAGSGLALF